MREPGLGYVGERVFLCDEYCPTKKNVQQQQRENLVMLEIAQCVKGASYT